MLWACLLGGWLGSCLRAGCVRLLVFALLVLARLLGVVGQSLSRRPFAPFAWLRVHALVWACWRVRGTALAPIACGVTVMGWDNVVPPHTAWRCPAVAWRGERGVACGVLAGR